MPLTGKTIIVTRDLKQAEPFASQLKDLGANVILFPTIETARPDEPEKVRDQLADISNYNWIIFTSANSVSYLFEFIGVSLADFKAINIACVGKKTAEVLASFNLSPTLVPQKYSAQDIVEAMRKYDIKGKHILIPVSNLAAHEIENELQALGAITKRVELYQTKTYQNPDARRIHEKISDGSIDCITFFSPSALNAFIQLMGDELVNEINFNQIAIAVIGSTTAKAADEVNLKPAIQPAQSDSESFLQALKEYYSENKN
jgi:uroporphyrinogen-III synthase